MFKVRALEALDLEKMLPEDFFVYFHQLSILAEEEHFGVGGGLSGRVKEITATFNVNKKQRESKKIRFINHVYTPEVSEDITPWYDDAEVGYIIPSSYFKGKLFFSSALITFVSKELRRVEHRKIKATISARPTPNFAPVLKTQRSQTSSTSLDINFKKSIQLSLPVDQEAWQPMSEEERMFSQSLSIGTVNVHGAASFGSGDINLRDLNLDLRRLLHQLASDGEASAEQTADLEQALEHLESGDEKSFKEKMKSVAMWIGKKAENVGLSALDAYIKSQII